MTRAGLLAFLYLAVLVSAARAGSISISITPTVEYANGALSVRVKVANSGDESAQTVLPQLRFRDQSARGTGKPTLPPNESYEETLTVPAPGLGTGRWPYRLGVDYTDVNQYPFQALQVGVVQVGNPPPGKLAVRIDALQLATTGSLDVHLKSLAGEKRETTVVVHVPEGIEVSAQPKPVQLDGYGETTVRASLVNRTALAGSRYPVFASGEYDDGDVHHAVIGQGTLEIVPPRSALGDNRNVFWIGAGVVVALWVAALVWQQARRRAVTRQA